MRRKGGHGAVIYMWQRKTSFSLNIYLKKKTPLHTPVKITGFFFMN